MRKYDSFDTSPRISLRIVSSELTSLPTPATPAALPFAPHFQPLQQQPFFPPVPPLLLFPLYPSVTAYTTGLASLKLSKLA